MEQKRPSQRSEIQFKPLSDGLGFHPFSDGLPYAPVSKKSAAPMPPRPAAAPGLSAGSGAVSAGPPRFATQIPRVSVPVAAAKTSAPSPSLASAHVPAPVPAPVPAMETPIVEPMLGAQRRYGIGYLFSRALAYLVDSSMNLVLCVALLSVALWRMDLRIETLMSSGVLGLTALFLLVLNWALIAAQEIAFGTSLGKRMFGLAIDGGALSIFFRAIFFIPSVTLGGLGLLWSLIDGKRRCWHDLVVDLQPIEIARL